MKLFFVLLLAAARTFAQEAQSALEALKALPKEDAARLVRIVGRDGAPTPEHWHFIVYDPAAREGFREGVVVGGAVIDWRQVSQFVLEVKESAVLGGVSLKLDSGQVARLVGEYALANGMEVASFNYQLALDGEPAVPTWMVSCHSEDGTLLGELLVNAQKGTVLSRDGFALPPPKFPDKPAKNRVAREASAPKPEVVALKARVSREKPRPAPEPPRESAREPRQAARPEREREEVAVARPRARAARVERRGDAPSASRAERPVQVQTPIPMTPRPYAVQQFGGRGFFQRIFRR